MKISGLGSGLPELILIVYWLQDGKEPRSGISRIVWCPYVPDDDEPLEDDDPSKLIVTHGNKV